MKTPFAIWITGLPASGKSTIRKALVEKLNKAGISVQVLESDELRNIITPKPTYSIDERDNFYNVMAYIGELLVKNGVNVIFDATANKASYRERAKKGIKNFIEVYINCPLSVCIRRDPKGIYKKAMSGGSATVPGLQEKYEEPTGPEIVIESDKESPEQGAEKIFQWLAKY
ncbi:MAG: adenylyl-sulfate kinase [Nitrospirota bacterium]